MKKVISLFLALILTLVSFNVVSFADNFANKDLVKQFEYVVNHNELVKKYLSEDEIQLYRNIVNIKIANPKMTAEGFLKVQNIQNAYAVTAGPSMESPGIWPFTAAETLLIFAHPIAALQVNACKNSTDNWTGTFYPGWTDGDIGNAYRHAFWNALMCKEIGPSLAEDFATAHEDHGLTDEEYAADSWYGFNGLEHRIMDLNNNHLGRIMAYPNDGELDIHNMLTAMIEVDFLYHLY